jgi:hypothetical protein
VHAGGTNSVAYPMIMPSAQYRPTAVKTRNAVANTGLGALTRTHSMPRPAGSDQGRNLRLHPDLLTGGCS